MKFIPSIIKLNPSRFLLILISLTACQSAGNSNPNNKASRKVRPNIILICADDLGWSDIGCYGSEVKTPNLDLLAENGIRFTQFHNTSKCFPSRACLLTGLYAQQVGYDQDFNQPLANSMTLGEVLRGAGYRTLWAGKHHGIENPVTRGFDRYYGLRDGCCNYFNPGQQREGEGKPAQKRERYWCFDSLTMQPYTPEEKDFYTTDYFTNYALGWLDEYENEEKPFFLYLAYTAPHDPLMAWPEDIDKYRGKYSAGYEEIRKNRFEKQKRSGLLDKEYCLSEATHDNWKNLPDSIKTEEEQKMEVYAAMIDRMDQNIGRVLDKLKENGEIENTLILFVADNGASAEMVRMQSSGEIGTLTRWSSLGQNWANVGNTPYRYYKNNSYEGGICTPLIAYWPGQITRPGRTSSFCGHFIDFMATFIDISGAVYPEQFHGRNILPYEGQSLVPVFRNSKSDRNKPLFWEWQSGQAVRKDQWKLVRLKNDIPWSLFNMNEDPSECNDLADRHPEIVGELNKMFLDWKAETDQY